MPNTKPDYKYKNEPLTYLLALAKDPSTHPDTLAILFQQAYDQVRHKKTHRYDDLFHALSENPNTPPETLTVLINMTSYVPPELVYNNPAFQLHLLANPSLLSELHRLTLTTLSFRNPHFRQTFLQNPTRTFKGADTLLRYDPHPRHGFYVFQYPIGFTTLARDQVLSGLVFPSLDALSRYEWNRSWKKTRTLAFSPIDFINVPPHLQSKLCPYSFTP